jgi:glucan phosphoethanolaminetransferase (alkaline phosphatase superfamily)
MNQFILNIMIVYSIASIVYILYLIFMKPEKISTIIDNNYDNKELLKEKYNNIKKNRIMVFIIGIVIGLGIIIMFETEPKVVQQITTSVKSIVDDVSDISVI